MQEEVSYSGSVEKASIAHILAGRHWAVMSSEFRSPRRAQEDIDRRCGQSITEIEGKLEQKTALLKPFSSWWKII
jgi:hypothetical protein